MFFTFCQYCLLSSLIKNFTFTSIIVNLTLLLNKIIILFFLLTKFYKYKSIIKLNIIAVFNKLSMHFKNKSLITFIYTLKLYKYYDFSFNLINDSIN